MDLAEGHNKICKTDQSEFIETSFQPDEKRSLE